VLAGSDICLLARSRFDGLPGQLVGTLVQHDSAVARDVDELSVPRRHPLFCEAYELLICLGLPALLQDSDRVLAVRMHANRRHAQRRPLECAQNGRQLRDVVGGLTDVFEAFVKLASRRDDDDPATRRPGIARASAVDIGAPTLPAALTRVLPFRAGGRGLRIGRRTRLVGKDGRAGRHFEVPFGGAVGPRISRSIAYLDAASLDRKRSIGVGTRKHALPPEHGLNPRHT
jgi:hypothetical protein